MNITRQQKNILKSAVLAAFPTLDFTGTAVNDATAAAWLSAVGTFVVWKTSVSKSDIYHQTSPEATTWDWPVYKAQTVNEQNAWTQMFMNDIGFPSLANFRAGVSAIFSGAGAAGQRTHIQAMFKRNATKAEELLASGSGTTGSPATMGNGAEGSITEAEAGDIMRGV